MSDQFPGASYDAWKTTEPDYTRWEQPELEPDEDFLADDPGAWDDLGDY